MDYKEKINSGKKNNKINKIIRELISLFFWLYIVIKIFIFDFDLFFIQRISPQFDWLLTYKFFVFLGILVIIFVFTKNKQIIIWTLFILFYPLILFFWKIPVYIFKTKSWNLLFSIIDSITSFFKSPKKRIIKTALFLISAGFILSSSIKIILRISILSLLIICFLDYVQRIIFVFKPSGIYSIYIKFVSDIGKSVRSEPPKQSFKNSSLIPPPNSTKTTNENDSKFDRKEILNLPPDDISESEIQTWVNNLQSLVLCNRIFLKISKKLKDYRKSNFTVVINLLSLIILIVFTVISFTLINYGFFKINPENFSFSSSPTVFTFFYYSFNILIFNSISELSARLPIVQIMAMIEEFFAFFLVAILISLVFSFKNDKENLEINELIVNLEQESESIETLIRNRFQINNIEEALLALRKLNSAIIEFLYKIT
jgi:hypothetical protein